MSCAAGEQSAGEPRRAAGQAERRVHGGRAELRASRAAARAAGLASCGWLASRAVESSASRAGRRAERVAASKAAVSSAGRVGRRAERGGELSGLTCSAGRHAEWFGVCGLACGSMCVCEFRAGRCAVRAGVLRVGVRREGQRTERIGERIGEWIGKRSGSASRGCEGQRAEESERIGVQERVPLLLLCMPGLPTGQCTAQCRVYTEYCTIRKYTVRK